MTFYRLCIHRNQYHFSLCHCGAQREGGRPWRQPYGISSWSPVGSGLILISIALYTARQGHLLMEPMAGGCQGAGILRKGDLFPLKMALVMMTSGLAVKAPCIPFSSWLPGAHANATAASSSVLSGLVLKGYIILLLKVYMRILGMDLIIRLRINDLLFVFGILAMVIGSAEGAAAAYGQAGHCLFIHCPDWIYLHGNRHGTSAGLAAAVLHMIVHAVTKPMLFTAAGGPHGLLQPSGREIAALRGSARRNPAAGAGLVVVGSMAMIGDPLFPGLFPRFPLLWPRFTIWTERFWCWGPWLSARSSMPCITYRSSIIVFSERGLEKADHEAAGLEDAAVPEAGEPVKDVSSAAAMACFWLGMC